MTITRRHHPFEGKTLGIFGHMHRHGCLQLILVHPDGTRSMIPAHWTDLDAGRADRTPDAHGRTDAPETIASPSDLLRARAVVDGLLRRVDSSAREEQQTAEEEGGRATEPELS